MTIKVLGIAPYPGLRDLLKELAAEVSGIEIHVEVADLEKALPLGRQAEQQGYDVIISRGGTASLVRQHVSLPVVDISVSGYDILRVLTLIKDSNSKVAIIGFPNICQGAATVSSLLDFEIPIYSIQHESEVRNALHEAFQNGTQIVLGDVVTVETAQEMGYHGILITSGRESVLEALAKAEQVSELFRRGQEQAQFLERVLHHTPQGVLAVDTAGRVRYLNPMAAELLGEDQERLQGQPVAQLPVAIGSFLLDAGANDTPVRQARVRVHERTLDVEIVTFSNGIASEYMVYLQPTEGRENMRPAREKKPVRLATFAQIIGSSSALQRAIQRAKSFAQADQNVWISGALGSGRSLFAQAIHAASGRSAEDFYTLACDSATRLELEGELFGTEEAPGLLTGSGTLYLEEIEHLYPPMQERLLQALREGSQVRVIASSTTPWAELAERGDFHQDLAYRLGELHLTIPSLQERLEDIEEIARVLIAVHNSQYGKQIVGLRSEVLERLHSHDWPGNVKELENVIGEMLLLTRGHYVSLQEADAVWERYDLGASSNTATVSGQLGGIDLSGSWEEIEQRILLQVLQEEGMNQSKAAKRLGLNRSTLWRKLRDVTQTQTE